MNLTEIKSLFSKVLIGCLVAAAGLAVVTVLIGKFNDVLSNALFTILLVAVHTLVSISFITNNEKQDTFESLTFFTDVTFGLIILSFITSVSGIWGILPGEVVARLYALYFVLMFAVLHGEVLSKTVGKQSNIDKVVFYNYFFMVAVVVMLLPIIFLNDSSALGGFYYRLLAALGIIDATLTLIAVILHNLYVQRHPKLPDPVFAVPSMLGQMAIGQQLAPATPQPKRGMNVFVLILIVFVGFQLVAAVIVGILGAAR
jgi:hypothetical protein